MKKSHICPWFPSQAIRNKVNRIAYINKLDKPAGDVQATINSLKTRLNITPLLTQVLSGKR